MTKEEIIRILKEDMHKIMDHVKKTGDAYFVHDWDNPENLDAVVSDVLKQIEEEEIELINRFKEFKNTRVQGFIVNFCIIMTKHLISSDIKDDLGNFSVINAAPEYLNFSREMERGVMNQYFKNLVW